MSTGRPRLLYILHAYHNRAGTEMHTKSLARLLANDFEIYIAYPEQGLLHLLTPTGVETHLPADPPIWPVTPYNQSVTENSLNWILQRVLPDIVHVQHFIYWPLSVLDRVIVTGKPVVVSLHDYYAITPLFTMEEVNEPSECFSKEYAAKLHHKDVQQYLLDRRDLLRRSLSDITLLIAPSQFAADTIRKIYDLPIEVIEHGIAEFPNRKPIQSRKGVRFGYIGSLLPQKGWESLLAAFALLHAQQPETELHVWGGSPSTSYSGVTFHGVYEQEEIPSILSTVEVGVIPSVFRESFSLTLSEMWMAGLPVAVSDIGALGDRVKDGVHGRKFLPGDVRSMYETLKWFATNDSWREWEITKPRTEVEMADEYRTLYAALLMRS